MTQITSDYKETGELPLCSVIQEEDLLGKARSRIPRQYLTVSEKRLVQAILYCEELKPFEMVPVQIIFSNNYRTLTLPMDLSTSLMKHDSVGAQEQPLPN